MIRRIIFRLEPAFCCEREDIDRIKVVESGKAYNMLEFYFKDKEYGRVTFSRDLRTNRFNKAWTAYECLKAINEQMTAERTSPITFDMTLYASKIERTSPSIH